jgi:protoporphyrinogen oxidase
MRNPMTSIESTPLSQPQSVVVIGAGLAGLAAAIRLKERGVERVVVLEQAPKPGGLATSVHFGEFSADLGPHRVYTEIPEVERFVHEIAGDSLMTVKRRSRMRLAGRFLAYPPTVGEAIRGLGPLLLARFAMSWARTWGAALCGRVDRAGFEGQMRAAFGSALYEFLVAPFAEKVWKTDPRGLDADAARVRVSAGSLGKMVKRLVRPREKKGLETSLREFLYPRGGAETLVDRLAERSRALGAEIHCGCRVEGFLVEEGRVASVLAGSEGSVKFPADRVIATSPLTDLVEALDRAAPLGEETLEAARSLRYLDMILVYLVVERDRICGDHWIYFPEPRFVFNRASEAKAFDPAMGPPGRSVLCVEITCRPGKDLWPEADDAIARRVVEDLARTGLFDAGEVSERHVHRLRHAYPVYDRGYREKVAKVLAGLSRFGNLIPTGRQGLFNFNNMDHTIQMGLRAAECATAWDSPAQQWFEEIEAFRAFRIVD